jgi:hypothetical protein
MAVGKTAASAAAAQSSWTLSLSSAQLKEVNELLVKQLPVFVEAFAHSSQLRGLYLDELVQSLLAADKQQFEKTAIADFFRTVCNDDEDEEDAKMPPQSVIKWHVALRQHRKKLNHFLPILRALRALNKKEYRSVQAKFLSLSLRKPKIEDYEPALLAFVEDVLETALKIVLDPGQIHLPQRDLFMCWLTCFQSVDNETRGRDSIVPNSQKWEVWRTLWKAWINCDRDIAHIFPAGLTATKELHSSLLRSNLTLREVVTAMQAQKFLQTPSELYFFCFERSIRVPQQKSVDCKEDVAYLVELASSVLVTDAARLDLLKSALFSQAKNDPGEMVIQSMRKCALLAIEKELNEVDDEKTTVPTDGKCYWPRWTRGFEQIQIRPDQQSELVGQVAFADVVFAAVYGYYNQMIADEQHPTLDLLTLELERLPQMLEAGQCREYVFDAF